MNLDKEYYRLSEVAKMLGVCKKSVEKMRREGGLKAVQFGKVMKMWMVHRDDVKKLVS